MPGHLSPNVYDSDGQHEVRSHVAEVGTHEYAWHEAIEKGCCERQIKEIQHNRSNAVVKRERVQEERQRTT